MEGILYSGIEHQSQTISTDSIKITVSAGWNLLSLPVLVVDGRKNILFPHAISDAFKYENGYQTVDTLEFGKAYWLKFAVPETITVTGTAVAVCSVAVKTGWNMVGTPSIPISTSLLKTIPTGIISTTLYKYNTTGSIYEPCTTLEPGYGYWVKVKQSGKLKESCWGDNSEVLLSPPEGYRTITSPKLRWKHSLCNSIYRLQIAGDTLFQNVLKDTTLTDTSYQSQFDCIDTVYHWRIGIYAQDSLTIWLDKRKFTWTFFDDELKSPSDNGGTTLTPTLIWRKVQCATNYRLQFSEDSIFNNFLIDSLFTDTSYQCTELDSAQDYFWRIGIGGTNPILWTKTRKFSATWRYLGLGNEIIEALAVDLADPNIMYAGSESDFSGGTVGSIFKSTNGGATWDTLIRGVTVRDLDIHPTNPNIIFATLGINVLTPEGIIKSTNAGNTWVWADSGIWKDWEVGPGVLVIDPQYPETLFTGTGGPMGGAIYKSTNGGSFWFRVSPDTGGLIASTMSLAINPINTNVVYAGTDDLGEVYKTTDGGTIWNRTSLRDKGMIYDIAINPISAETLFAGTWRFGLYMSSNGGYTWFRYDSDFNIVHGTVFIIIVDTTNSGKIICAASGGVYKERINNYWERIGIDPFKGAAGALVLQRNTLYAGMLGVYRYLK